MKKNWQKLVALMMILALCASLVVVFTACEERLIDKEGTAYIVVAAAQEGGPIATYEVDLSKVKGNKGLISVFDYLQDNEGFIYTAIDSDYGLKLTRVNELRENVDTSEYIYLYTTVTVDQDTSAYATSVQYNNLTIVSSGVGASQMHIKAGCTIYVGIIKW